MEEKAVGLAIREVFVGFDSAWAGKAPGGLAWASFANGEFVRGAPPQSVDFLDAARIIKQLSQDHDFVLVGLDQPIVVPNETGSRPVDRVAGSLIFRLKGGVQRANRGSPLFDSDAPIWRFLDCVGACQDPLAGRSAAEGLHLVEVLPALSLPALAPHIFDWGAAARYNPAKRKRFHIGDWLLVSRTVGCHAKRLELPLLAEWAMDAANTERPGKADQDKLDAAICLVVALLFARSVVSLVTPRLHSEPCKSSTPPGRALRRGSRRHPG